MLRRALPALAVVAVAAASSLPAWLGPVRWTPDGFFYQARLLQIRGADEKTAVRTVLAGPLVANARGIDGPQLDRLRDPEWVEHTTAITQRRVLVPTLGAAVYPVFGDFSLQAVSILGYIALAPLLYLLLRRRFSARASAIVAAGVLLLPPLREWSFRPLTDSWGLTLTVGCLLAAALALDRGPRWLPAWAAAVAALSLTRDAAVVVAFAAAWVALRERTRTTLALALTGIAAAAPAPLLLGAPVSGTVRHSASDLGRYWESVSQTVRIDVLSQVVGAAYVVPAVALVLGLAFASWRVPARLVPARTLVLVAATSYLGLTLVATAVLATRRVEPMQQVPVGLVLLLGLLLLFLPSARRPDAYLRLHRAAAVACVGYLALFPVPSGFRLELVCLPLLAVGFARALDARGQAGTATASVARFPTRSARFAPAPRASDSARS